MDAKHSKRSVVYAVTALAAAAALALAFLQFVFQLGADDIESLSGSVLEPKWWPVYATACAGIALVAISLGALLSGSRRILWEVLKIGLSIAIAFVAVGYTHQLVIAQGEAPVPAVATTPDSMAPASGPR